MKISREFTLGDDNLNSQDLRSWLNKHNLILQREFGC